MATPLSGAAALARALQGRAGWAVGLACVAAVVVLGITETAFQSATNSLTSLGLRAQARTDIQTVMRRLLDAETAQRGYLLTGRKDYLAPFGDVATDVTASISRLRKHYAHDPEGARTVEALSQRTLEKLSEASETIILYDSGQHERWRDLLLTDIGREKMEAARQLAETLLATEDGRVVDARADVFKTLSLGRIGVRVMTLLSLLALVFFFLKTAALQRAQAQHAQDLKVERDTLEADVRERTAELTELTRHLQTAREDERGHLARELHDELGALLTAAKLDVARMKRAIGAPAPELAERLQHLVSTIDQGISLKRRIIEDLRPSSLSNLGLSAALDIQAREFAQRSGLVVQAQIEEAALTDEAQIVVYRVMQESFTNISKHAKAHHIKASLKNDGAHACLRIHDDGKGFNTTAKSLGSHGLLGMRYRVESVGGDFSVDSAAGRGTTIEARVPLRAAAAEAAPAAAPCREPGA